MTLTSVTSGGLVLHKQLEKYLASIEVHVQSKSTKGFVRYESLKNFNQEKLKF